MPIASGFVNVISNKSNNDKDDDNDNDHVVDRMPIGAKIHFMTFTLFYNIYV